MDEYRLIQSGSLGCKLLKTLLLLFSSLWVALFAEAQPFICRQFSANDGLPSSYCFQSFQDTDGYLWVGTYGGAGRFDGTTFKKFTVNDGLVNNQVVSFCQDKQGTIWFGTFNGISRWKQGRFKHITAVGKIPIERVYDITEASDGRIWATSDQGLLLFENPDAAPKLFQLDNHNQPVKRLWGVNETTSGEILVSNSRQLFVFDKNRFVEIKYDNGQSIEARCLVRIGNQMLIGTYEQGVVDYQAGKVKPVYANSLPANLRVFDILQDKRQRLWLATNQGAFCIDKGKVTQLSTKNYLPSDKCLGISQDLEGNIWLTSPEGLIQCKERFIAVYNKTNGLLNDEIYSLAKDKDGVIYFGGCNGAFTAYRQGTFFQPYPAFGVTKTSGLPIHFTKFDQQGDLWISCDAEGVYKISKNRVEKITATGNFCSAFIEDKTQKSIWMGNRESLFRYQYGQWITINPPPVMAIDDILALYQDKQKRLWIGTYGLRIFDGKTWVDLSRRTNTKDVFIQTIKTDVVGNIWVGTIGKGIRKIRMDAQGNILTVESITTRQGLQNDSVLDIEFDNEGQLWVGSFGGIMRIDLTRPKEKGQYISRLFNRTSGVIDNTWQVVSLLKDNAGNMWAGTSTGAMRIDIQHIPTNKSNPPVHITSAQLLQNAFEPTTNSQNIAANAVLPYNQNTLNFQFTGISLSDPTGIRYTYKLDGLPESNWSSFSSERSINFSNLPPNTYTLYVKAINADGIESKQASTFTFTINPPFWQTWWFRGILALVMAGAILAIVQLRIRFLNEKHKVALQLSEWKLKALQSQMNPHFIFNSLNSIQNFIITSQPIEGVRYLSKFSRLIRKILENSNYQQMRLEQIVETLQMYVELEAMRFNHEFSYQFIIDDNEILHDTLLPPMLFQPFVENAIWHGLMPQNGEKKLLIQVKKQADTLLCIIDDNGVGRKNVQKKAGHTSRGESITQHTFDAFNQQMGKEVTLTIIDKELPLSGTRVEIRVPL